MKKLMNEVLPAPVIAPRGSPRDRVLRHMRDALAAGASVALLTGCPFAVVDPLPQPALCRSQGAETLVTAKVTKTEIDAGLAEYVVVLTFKSNAGLVLQPPTAMNATLVSSTDTEIRVTTGATQFDLLFAGNCDDGRTAARKLGVRIIVDAVNLTASVAEVP